MKITRAQQELLGSDESELSPAERKLLTTLLRDPELHAIHDRMITIGRVISLKRYEAPPSSAEDRCVRAIRLRITDGNGVREVQGLTFTRVLSGIAAACVVLFAIQAAVTPPSGALRSTVAGRDAPTLEEFVRRNLGSRSLLFLDSPFHFVPTGDYAYSNVVPPNVNRSSIFFINEQQGPRHQ